MQASAGKNVE